MEKENIIRTRQELENALNANDSELIYEKAKELEALLDTEEIKMSEEWMDGFFYLVSLFPRLYEKDDLEGWFSELVYFFLNNASPYYLKFMHNCSDIARFFQQNGYIEKCDLLCMVNEQLLNPLLENIQDLTVKDYDDFYPTIVNISIVFYTRQNFEKAIQWSKTGVTVAEYFLNNTPEVYLDAINWLASIYYYSSNFSEAIGLLSSVLLESKFGILEKQDSSLVLINNLAQNIEMVNDAEGIFKVYQELIGFYGKFPLQCRKLILTLQNDLARQYSRFGRPDRAVKLLNTVVSGRREDKDFPPKDFAIILASYGNNLLTLGQYDQAEKIIREALDIRKEVEGEKSAFYARSLAALANVYNSTKRYEKAEELANQAIEILKQDSENATFYNEAITPLTHALQGLKRLDEAAKAITEVLEIYRNINNKNLLLQEIFLRSNLAGIYEKQGKLSEAVEEDFVALNYFRNNFHPSTYGYGELISRPINALIALQRFDEAFPLIDEVIELLSNQKADNASFIPFYYCKAVCYKQTGKADESEALFKECLSLTERYKGKKNMEYINTTINILDIYLQTDRLNEAYKSGKMALELATDVYEPLNGDLLQLKSLYGSILFRLGKKDESYQIYKDILEVINNIHNSVLEKYGELLYQIAFRCYHDDNYESALKMFSKVHEMQDIFLRPEDKRRNKISNVIAQLENQLNRKLPDNIIPISGLSDEKKAEHIDTLIYSKCVTAFSNEDFSLCIRLGENSFYGFETFFLVVLSYLFLKRKEDARIYGKNIEKLLIHNSYPSLLYRLIMREEEIKNCLETAQNNRERCSFYMYEGASLIAEDKHEEGIEKLNIATTFLEDENQPFIEIVFANQILANLKNKRKNHPTEIENQIRKLYEQLYKERKNGNTENDLKVSLEIRDWASKLGKNHPTYGDALINLADSYTFQKNDAETNSLLKRGLDIICDFFPATHWEIEKTAEKIYNYINVWSEKSLSEPRGKYLFIKRLLIVLSKYQNEDILIAALLYIPQLNSSEYYPKILDEMQQIFTKNPVLNIFVKLIFYQISIEEALKLCQNDRHQSMANCLEGIKLISVGKYNPALNHLNEVIRLNTSGIEKDWALNQKETLEKQLRKTDNKLDTNFLFEELEKAFSFVSKGQFTEAYELSKNIEKMMSDQGSLDIGVAAKAFYELGIIFYQCSCPDDAIAIQEQAISKIPQSHSYYPMFLTGLGVNYLSKKDLSKAKSYLDEAYEFYSDKNNKVSRGYKDLLHAMITLHQQLLNGKEVEKYSLELVEISKILSGDTSQDYAYAFIFLAQTYFQQGKIEDAQKVAQKAYDLSKKVFGNSEAVTLQSMIFLAKVTFSLDSMQGEEKMDECVKLILANESIDDETYLKWLNDAISIYYENQRYAQSKELSQKILGRFPEDNSNNHERYRFLKYIADSLHGEGRFEEALDYRQKILEISSNLFGSDSSEYGENMEILAMTLDALGENEKAEKLFDESLRTIYQLNI